MQKFDTPAAISAVLDVPAGRIRVIAADRADTAVEVLPVDPSRGRDVEAAERTAVDFRDGVLRITAPAATKRVRGASGSVEVTVQLPAGSRIDATAAATGFRGVGRFGDVACHGAHGAVEIDEAARLRVAAHAADVTVGRLTGPAEISTEQGAIHVAEATSGSVVLHTRAGDVRIGAARGVCASLDAGTSHGRVHNALTSTGGPAGLRIHATTQHGDITARSL